LDHEPPSRGRETALAIALVLILGGTLVFFLNFITFGLFFYVIVAVLVIGAVGGLHYLLWGQSLNDEVAGEREEAELRDKMEADHEAWILSGRRPPVMTVRRPQPAPPETVPEAVPPRKNVVATVLPILGALLGVAGALLLVLEPIRTAGNPHLGGLLGALAGLFGAGLGALVGHAAAKLFDGKSK
jgi:hypothetical protein